jgi:hypothetical protein
MLKPNNILSYFLKDIKDPKECALYKQINTNTDNIEIFYKDAIIYRLQCYRLNPEISWNYTKNIFKKYYPRRITNHKIGYPSIKIRNSKALFYKKDKIISKTNENYIMYDFIYNKYLIKKNFDYVIKFKSLLYTRIEYYNGYKYFIKYGKTFKYNYVHIFIMNKYELHYINRFFSIYN